MRNLKDLVMAGFLALSKVEQDSLKESLLDDGEHQEQQQQKNQIKLISKKHFYEILERADGKKLAKYKDKLDEQLKRRGLEGIEVIFRNESVPTSMHDDTPVFKFKTDNKLYAIADVVHVNSLGDTNKELTFFINTKKFPTITSRYTNFTGLSKFEITDNHREYSYNITNFITMINVSEDEIALKFNGYAVKDGVKIEYDDEVRILRREDLDAYKNKNYTLNPNDIASLPWDTEPYKE